MGKRGPAKTPKSVLKLRGSPRANLNPDEPQPEQGIPDPPRPLTGEALRMWHHITAIIDAMGILTEADGIMLCRYCLLWEEWNDCQAKVAELGTSYVVETKSGDKMARMYPHAQRYQKLTDQMLRLEQEFGLSPSSRASVRVPGGKRSKKKSRFFEKKGSRAG